jgi:hypothetical protein
MRGGRRAASPRVGIGLRLAGEPIWRPAVETPLILRASRARRENRVLKYRTGCYIQVVGE